MSQQTPLEHKVVYWEKTMTRSMMVTGLCNARTHGCFDLHHFLWSFLLSKTQNRLEDKRQLLKVLLFSTTPYFQQYGIQVLWLKECMEATGHRLGVHCIVHSEEASSTLLMQKLVSIMELLEFSCTICGQEQIWRGYGHCSAHRLFGIFHESF